MNIKNFFSLFIIFCLPSFVFAKINIVTTTTDLAYLCNEIGGEFVQVESIVKGTQDPHFIEAKPSFMSKVSHADLVVAIGLGLEVGWLPSIIRGARNPNLQSGQLGFLEVGPFANPLEVPSGNISRADGDVHPEGNPHVTLDPMRSIIIAEKISEHLSKLDQKHADFFKSQAVKFRQRLVPKITNWKQRIEKTGIKYVITYHKTLNYFLNAFNLINPIDLEPKPGIPPTSKHILAVMDKIKELNIPIILVENFFDVNSAERIKHDIPNLKTASVPVAVDGNEKIKSLDDLYENLVVTLESASNQGAKK